MNTRTVPTGSEIREIALIPKGISLYQILPIILFIMTALVPAAHAYRLNPVAVLVSVLFWYYMWGVPGAFLAVPIIATIKVLGEHLESLAPVAEFLSD